MISTHDAPVLVHSSSSSSLREHATSAPLPTLGARSDAKVSGLKHHPVRLSARKYKSADFRADLLRIVRALAVPTWAGAHVEESEVEIRKVSGSLTNAVFFVSSSAAQTKTLLLRIYGPSSGNLISRPDELRMLHVLSSHYRIGPRLYGTFENGRLEEYFDSDALTPEEMRAPEISQWIAKRMAEMHRVSIEAVVGPKWSIAAVENVLRWMAPARAVLALVPPTRVAELGLDLDRFQRTWDAYLEQVYAWELSHGQSARVFAHNDAQYGNLLKLRKAPASKPAHHQVRGDHVKTRDENAPCQIIVVDFEYAAPNPAAFDIANHFQEWTTAYNSTTPHVLRPDAYPDASARRNFYRAYLGTDAGVERVEDEVRVWSAACHGMWAVWSIVQAREQVEAGQCDDFDYLRYAGSRLREFYDGCDSIW